MTEQLAKDEIEKGFSAVKLALGAAPAPFFRFPELQHGPAAMAYLGIAQRRDVLLRPRLLRFPREESPSRSSTP